MARLGDLIEQIRGVSYRPEDMHDELNENSVMLLRANNIRDGRVNFDEVVYVDKSKAKPAQYLKAGDIFVCASSGSKELVGKAAYVPEDVSAVFGAFCKVVRPKIDCHRYIGHFFDSPSYRKRISALAAGANINNIRNEHIDELPIYIPSGEEQMEISDVLDLVNNMIFRRREQLAKLDELVKARFVELFGDPVANEKGWNTKPLLEMGSCKNGMNFHYEDKGVEISCLGVGDFKEYSTISDTSALPTVSLNEMPSDDYMLKDNDIVFVRSNGNKALVGRSVAVYPGKVPTTFSGFCIRYRKTDETLNIPYLLRVLKTESVRQKMTGRGANIQNLNQQILGTLIIPVPPIELQNQFATFVKQTDKSKLAVQKSLEELEILKKALMQKYFGKGA